MSSSDKSSIRVSSYGCGKLEVAGLQDDEVATIRGSILGGHSWIRRGSDGRLETVASYETLPEPFRDETMIPHWGEPIGENRPLQLQLFSFFEMHDSREMTTSPSFFITGLCPFDRDFKENYPLTVEALESFGFEALRSRRDTGGSYWVFWHLSGLWSAKGRLKEFIELNSDRDTSTERRVHFALEYLKNNISFGSLELTYQRLCTPNPD